MSEVHYCDICEEVLKGDVFILTVTKVSPDTPDKRPMTTLDLFQAMEKNASGRKSNTKVKEICEECYKILRYLFTIRLKTLRNLRKETDKYEKFFKEGEPNGEQKSK